MKRILTAALLLLLLSSTDAYAQTRITDEVVTQFTRGREAEEPEFEKVAEQIEELDEKIEKFRECYQLVAGADDATGNKLGGLAGKAMLRARCGATSEDGFLKDKQKLLEQPEKAGAAAAGMKLKDYAKLKELFTLYLHGSRNFPEAELAVLNARGAALSNALGIPLAEIDDAGDGSGGRARVATGLGFNMRAMTPDMTWAYVGYLWSLMYMSGATMFETPYESGQWTTWEVTSSDQPEQKLLIERALISREADKSEWWRIKTIRVGGETADTIVLESLFKPADDEGLTMNVVRMRGKMPGEKEAQELMVPQHLTTLSMTAFPMKPTPESVEGATVGTEKVTAGSQSWSAKRVRFGSAGGTMEWWLADKAPGGVVKVQYSGQEDEKWTMAMTGAGSGAKSELGVK